MDRCKCSGFTLQYEGSCQCGYSSTLKIKQAKEKENKKWIPFDEFDIEPNEGWCWIVYKGRVVEAWRDYVGNFMFHPYSENCYLRECISHAQLMNRPLTPAKDGD